VTEVFGDSFYQGFESLQQHSNEKQVYLATFIEYIDRYEVTSLLDIGAGNGELAEPISEHVDRYVAVERNPQYAAMLRATGKTVVEQLFPTEIEGEYDLVVMSHVVSHMLGNYTALVPPAWDLVKPDGHLLIVTNQDTEEGDWSRLLDSIQLGYPEQSIDRLMELVGSLRERGETDIQRVSSVLRTENVAQMIEAMAFLAASGGNTHYARFMEKAGLVAKILQKHYRTKDGFTFPLVHPFISTRKPTP
jgi:2-polyprenyl-3-methyl-5-hydroxy-6-metoxy-1,4-benzoquinol methylase